MKPDGRRFALYLRRRMAEYHALLSGRRAVSQLARIEEEFAELHEPTRISAELDAINTGTARHRLLARRRLLARSEKYLAWHSRQLIDELQTDKCHATVWLEGEVISFLRIADRLAQTSDASTRRALGDAQVATARQFIPRILAAWKSHHERACELGYSSYSSAYAAWKTLDLTHIETTALEILDATSETYRQALANCVVRELRLTSEQISDCDIPRLFRGQTWDTYFPAKKLLPTLERTLQALKLIETNNFPFQIDLEQRASKSPRPYCAPIRVPQEVYLVACPGGGHRDWEAVFHEAGHALHFSFTSPILPWELRCLACDTTAETHAYLLASLLRSPEYLETEIGMPADVASRYASYATFLELFMVRRYAGKTLFELDMHKSSEQLYDASKSFTKRMRDAVGVAVPWELGLLETDTGLYAVEYLLAWLFEAALRQRLLTQYGPRWFADGKAGELLRQLWFQGPALPPSSVLDSPMTVPSSTILFNSLYTFG